MSTGSADLLQLAVSPAGPSAEALLLLDVCGHIAVQHGVDDVLFKLNAGQRLEAVLPGRTIDLRSTPIVGSPDSNVGIGLGSAFAGKNRVDEGREVLATTKFVSRLPLQHRRCVLVRRQPVVGCKGARTTGSFIGRDQTGELFLTKYCELFFERCDLFVAGLNLGNELKNFL